MNVYPLKYIFTAIVQGSTNNKRTVEDCKSKLSYYSGDVKKLVCI